MILLLLFFVTSSNVLGGLVSAPPSNQYAQLPNNFDTYDVPETLINVDIPQAPRNSDPYRLNTTVLPQNYSITLKLEQNFGTTQEFTGNVTILIAVQENTSLIQLHSKYLSIPENGVQLFCGGNSPNLFQELEFEEEYEMLYVRVLEVLTAGSVCELSFTEFSGVLADDMYGFYRSYYLDENGQTV